MAAFVLVGCYPKEDLYYSDLDIAVTHYDKDYDFNELSDKVCVLFDTVAHVVGEDEDLPDGKYDRQIIDDVLRNLKETGFETVYLVKDSTDIIEGQEPDMAMTITVWETDVYNYYYYPWYNYWYWGWGWYWKSGSMKSAENMDYYYYPYYPWGGSYYSYTTGTIMLDIVNPDESGDQNRDDEPIELPIIWTGAINGILSGSSSDQETRITNEIDQVFAQSPYLFN